MTILNLSPAEFFALDDFMYFQQDRVDDTVTDNEVKSILEMSKQQGILHILDTPCGYGRHSKAFMKLGHRVTGIDISPCFIAQAQMHDFGDRGQFIQGEMDNMMEEHQFDLIVNLFNSFGYYPHARNIRFLERCARQLKSSGEIVIDTINGATLESSGFMKTVVINKGDENLIIKKEVSGIQYEQGVSLQYTITSHRKDRSCCTTFDVVFYRPEELARMLHHSGFKQVDFYSGLVSDRNWNPESKKMVVVAQK
ncbi:methyltransferase domain-containing protein [Xenorhabdus sp. 12]|uniref:Methyltransferase domain-containing protein n=1 Tax=Xenorhabdus santafensis TaxID=2582833 RepID=A0ABU4SEL1_9GAMM|nr:methyltransferase domain-containing protein [Xenorhabdus sp. 12]MDX7989234.1 methyltransferase domain-containing protein [Xenorhabdus sp. 12]